MYLRASLICRLLAVCIQAIIDVPPSALSTRPGTNVYIVGCDTSMQSVEAIDIIRKRAWSEADKQLLPFIALPRMGDSDLSTADGGNVLRDDMCFFFQAEDGIRDLTVTGVQTCALPI